MDECSHLIARQWANDSGEVLREDAERVFCHRHAFEPVLAGAEHPTFESINRLARGFELGTLR